MTTGPAMPGPLPLPGCCCTVTRYIDPALQAKLMEVARGSGLAVFERADCLVLPAVQAVLSVRPA